VFAPDALLGTPAPVAGRGTGADAHHAGPGRASHRWPQVCPTARRSSSPPSARIGFENSSVAALLLETGERRTLVEGGGYGRYVHAEAGSGAPDYLVWAQGGELLGQRIK
jgi:hypothetical protein